MKFPELFERVIRELGHADVYCAKYPELRDVSQDNPWVLWIHDGVFDVGSDGDRGEWGSMYQFETEEAACAYLYDLLTRKPELWVQTPEEEQHSREVTEETNRKWEARQEYWRQHGEYPPEDQ